MLMPSSLTLAQAKASSIANIAGVCADSDQFVQQLNEACQRLMTYGSFFNTVVKGRVCVYDHCVTWPPWVGTILSMRVCGRNVQISNLWAEQMPLSPDECMGLFGGLGGMSHWGHHMGTNGAAAVIDDGIACVFRNIPCGQEMPLQVHTRLQADVGKGITFYGIDDNGQEIMSRDVMKNWHQGLPMVLQIPDQVTTVNFREVTRVSKDATVGPIDVYALDVSTGMLIDLAHYGPRETEPRYRHTTMRSHGMGGACAKSIEFICKLQFVPAILDTDLIQIDNIAALKLMLRAIRLEEAGNDQAANQCQAAAIHELNRQLNEKLPLNQIPIAVESFGTAIPALAGIGRII